MAEHISASLHHLRFSSRGGETAKDEAVELLAEYLGDVKETRRGKFFCSTAWYFEGGAALHFGNNHNTVVIDVPGSVCDRLGLKGCRDLARGIYALLGWRCKRADLAVDFFSRRGSELIWRIQEASRSAEIIRSPHVNRYTKEAAGGRIIGDTVYVGERTSSKFLRVYDKGLEDQPMTMQPGDWVRWELEAKDGDRDYANVVMQEVSQATDGELAQTVARIALGAFDFRRQSDCRNDRHADRRQRCSWYAELVAAVGRVVVRASKRLPSAAGFLVHMRTAVAQLQRLADETGQNLVQAIKSLGDVGTADLRVGSGLEKLLIFVRSCEQMGGIEWDQTSRRSGTLSKVPRPIGFSGIS